MTFGNGSFLLDPNMTPDQLARKRAAIQNMVAGYGNEKYISTGIVDLIGGILAGQRGRKLDGIESDQTAQATAQFNALLGGGMQQPQQPQQQPAMPGDGGVSSMSLNDPRAIAADTMSILGYAPSVTVSQSNAPMSQQDIVAGLVQRGLPQHVATGIAMNLKDESGFNPAAVGDNGNALGLAQWNGPRKQALIDYATKTGAQPTDPNVQLDFLMQELNGPEAAAGKAVLAAPDASTAATAFLNQYERPAEQYRAQRAAAYGGAPQAQGGIDQASLMSAMANPWLSPDQKAILAQMLQTQMGQQQKANDPMYQLQLQKAQNDAAVAAGLAPSGDMLQLQQRAQAAGLIPGSEEYKRFMLLGGSMGGQGRGTSIIWGTDAKGNPVPMQAGPDGSLAASTLPDGVTPMDPASKAYETALGQGMGENAADAQNLLPQYQTQMDQIDTTISALASDPYLENMLGPLDSHTPNVTANAARVQGLMNQLQGGAFLQARQMLKGGGAITDYEGRKAEEAFARLQTAQSAADYRSALDDFRNFVHQGLLKLQAQASQTPNTRYGGAQQPAAGGTLIFDPATGTFK